MLKVVKVPPEIVRPLRHKVLRPSLPFDTSCLSSDHDDGACHFAVLDDETIMSVASVYYELFAEFPGRDAFRLRGMATEPEQQGKGFGSKVLDGMVSYLQRHTKAQLLWCNARVSVIGFYEKMGFEIIGKEFDIPNLGSHKTGYFKLKE